MKPSARIQTIIDILDILEAKNLPMDILIGDYMRSRRYIGSKDRAFIAETLYDLMRAWGRLHWHLESLKSEPTNRARILAWLALGTDLGTAQITQYFNGEKYAPAPLSSDEAALLEKLSDTKLEPDAMPAAVCIECPPQYENALKQIYGENFEAELSAMRESATLDIRVNINALMGQSDTHDDPRDHVLKTYQSEKVECEPTPYSPWGIRMKNKIHLSQTKPFKKGWVDIQDEGSQLIALLCDPKPGAHILDYCAGGGGKTLALACAMRNKGRLVATDTDGRRLEKSRPRFKRAHVHDIIETRDLSVEKNRKWLRRQKQKFDCVLTDVPCSGTGTWRRNPDSRWRNYGPPLDELLQTQSEILDRVAPIVKPGGRLVYATCSILPQENEEQIATFLSRNSDFEIMKLSDAWPVKTQKPCNTDMMRLSPLNNNTDGFFAAVLTRK